MPSADGLLGAFARTAFSFEPSSFIQARRGAKHSVQARYHGYRYEIKITNSSCKFSTQINILMPLRIEHYGF